MFICSFWKRVHSLTFEDFAKDIDVAYYTKEHVDTLQTYALRLHGVCWQGQGELIMPLVFHRAVQ